MVKIYIYNLSVIGLKDKIYTFYVLKSSLVPHYLELNITEPLYGCMENETTTKHNIQFQ